MDRLLIEFGNARAGLIIAGPSGCGKTTRAKALILRAINTLSRVLVFSASAVESPEEWSGPWKNKLYISSLSDESLSVAIDSAKATKRTGRTKPILFVFDDVTHILEVSATLRNTVSGLTTYARHFHIKMLMLVHRVPSILGALARSNLDGVLASARTSSSDATLIGEENGYNADAHKRKKISSIFAENIKTGGHRFIYISAGELFIVG